MRTFQGSVSSPCVFCLVHTKTIRVVGVARAFVCEPCWQELTTGAIHKGRAVHFTGGSYGPTDDTSPSWDNAVGLLEDGRD